MQFGFWYSWLNYHGQIDVVQVHYKAMIPRHASTKNETKPVIIIIFHGLSVIMSIITKQGPQDEHHKDGEKRSNTVPSITFQNQPQTPNTIDRNNPKFIRLTTPN